MREKESACGAVVNYVAAITCKNIADGDEKNWLLQTVPRRGGLIIPAVINEGAKETSESNRELIRGAAATQRETTRMCRCIKPRMSRVFENEKE